MNTEKNEKMRNVGIYVHIPFCIQKCKYCDFISFGKYEEYYEKYIRNLIDEIENCDKKEFIVDTIYFGGGTPSVIPEELISELMKKIREKFRIENTAEITIEVNPKTVDRKKLKKYRQVGFNRISIGLQAIQNDILKLIGRIHTFEDFEKCYQEVKEVGFQNINVDLMLALPKQSTQDLVDSIKKVITLAPNHISLYSLILEDNTELKQQVEKGILSIPSEEEERKMYHLTKKILEENGYSHYEISNFAKKGYESKHNMNCWNQKEYLGFGIAAHSYFDKKRYSNTTQLEKYLESQKENVEINEIQDELSEKREYMMLGLRKIQGISISAFERKFEVNPLFYFRFEISKLSEEQLIEVDLDNIRLTKKGLDFANKVFEEFV